MHLKGLTMQLTAADLIPYALSYVVKPPLSTTLGAGRDKEPAPRAAAPGCASTAGTQLFLKAPLSVFGTADAAAGSGADGRCVEATPAESGESSTGRGGFLAVSKSRIPVAVLVELLSCCKGDL